MDQGNTQSHQKECYPTTATTKLHYHVFSFLKGSQDFRQNKHDYIIQVI